MDAELKSLEGSVTQQVVAPGSKSERPAVVLKATDGRTYLLRRQDRPAFVDPGLTSLVGRTIKASGVVADKLFVMRDWEITA
jgi:hypothetical protein